MFNPNIACIPTIWCKIRNLETYWNETFVNDQNGKFGKWTVFLEGYEPNARKGD